MGKLAGAVAAAGGVGLIGVGTSLLHSPERVLQEWQIAQQEIAAQKKNPNPRGALGFGFLEGYLTEPIDPSFEACLKLHPDVIFLGGFVTDERMQPHLIQTIRSQSASSKIIVQTFTVPEAVQAAQLGADAVVLQGSDAGGHGRQSDTGASIVSLIPQARRALQAVQLSKCVLVAAGGIATGRQMAAALLLGADGVHVGSAFVVTEESLASEAFKQRILDTQDGTSETVASIVWDKLHKMGGPFRKGNFTGRALSDSEALRRFRATLEHSDAEATEADKDWYAASGESQNTVWTSTSAGLILHDGGPAVPIKAGELVERLTAEAIQAIQTGGHFEIVAPEKESERIQKSTTDDNGAVEL